LPQHLPSELHTQPDITLLLLLVGLEAATTPHVSAISLAVAFQAYWQVVNDKLGFILFFFYFSLFYFEFLFIFLYLGYRQRR